MTVIVNPIINLDVDLHLILRMNWKLNPIRSVNVDLDLSRIEL